MMRHVKRSMLRPHVGALVIAALVLLPACAKKPPDKGLVKDLETLMPDQPQVPPAAAEAPQSATVLYADDLVGVTKLSLSPGEAIPEQPADRRVLYFLSSGTLGVAQGGQTRTMPVQEGDVQFFPAGQYVVRNAGQESLSFLIVDRTDVDLPDYMAALTGGGVPPGDVVFSNADVRVWRLSIQPDEEADLPQVPIRIVYSQGALVLLYTAASGQTEEVHTAAGEAFGRAGDDTSVTDIGPEAGAIVVFEWLV